MASDLERTEPIPGMEQVWRNIYKNPLKDRLSQGPIPFDELTAYLTREYYENQQIGRDFFTPPEYFPQLGNCYARFAIEVFEQLGQPDEFQVWEAGGGNGTLALGFLHEANKQPRFAQALQYHLIEQSSGLAKLQQVRLLEAGLADQVTWHLTDVTTFDFPDIPAGMYIAMENDDDLPSKAVYKQNSQPKEVYLSLENGLVTELVSEPSPELSDFIKSYPDWWEQFPEDLAVYLPVHIQSTNIREQLSQKIQKGAVLTADYGYTLSQVAEYSPHWMVPPYTVFVNNRRLAYSQSPFEDVLNQQGRANYTAEVDFSLLAQPGQRSGFDTQMVQLNNLLDVNGLRQMTEQHFSELDNRGQLVELRGEARRLAYLIDITANGWSTLVQTKGCQVSLNPEEKKQSLIDWFYSLTRAYNLGDVRPR